MRKLETSLAACSVLVSIGYLVYAFSLPVFSARGGPGAGFFPVVIGICFVVSSLIYLFQVAFVKKEDPEPSTHETDQNSSITREAAYLFSGVVLYVVLIPALGFLISTFLFGAGILRLVFKLSVSKAVGYAALVALCGYALFRYGLSVQLPSGLLL